MIYKFLIATLLIEIFFVVTLLICSNNKFNDILALIEKNTLLKNAYFRIGLQALSIVNPSFNTKYEKKLENKMKELYDPKTAHTLLKLNMAKKVAFILASVILINLMAFFVSFDTTTTLFIVAMPLLIWYLIDKQLDNQLKQKRLDIQLEFPEFLNKLILLINAGLTVHGALLKIVKDGRKSHPFYIELSFVMNEINAGKSEIEAYENFARRCKSQEITAFIAVLIQQMRKGNETFITVLRLHSNTCWENRKHIARRLGEEASTKLLLPTMIIFVALLAMMMTPAILQIKY